MDETPRKTANFVIRNNLNLTGTRKVGIDSGPLVDIIDNPMFFSDQTLKIFDETGLFYTHKICLGEVVNCLVEKSINKIWSTNNHFLAAGRLFDMDCEKFHHFEKELNDKFKEMFRR